MAPGFLDFVSCPWGGAPSAAPFSFQAFEPGPKLNSVIEVNPDALAIAEALDRKGKAGGLRGPLHGLPVLIKDNIATHDRMMTTAGSLALVGSVPSEDSFVARRLREAGAVIL